MEYTAENLEKVVTLFYRSETEQQAQAHQWLTEAQNSQQAWSFVWELLLPQQVSSEVQFFAATTLHTKLLKHWNEVPPEHYEQLKERILESIVKYAAGPKIVLNRLCIALSAYIIHTVPAHWPGAFQELVRSFQPENLPGVEPKRVLWILLDILTVIPEEFLSASLPAAQRLRVRCLLQKASADIFRVLEACLAHLLSDGFAWHNHTMYLHAARCVSAWMHLEGVDVSQSVPLVRCLVSLACGAYWSARDGGAAADEAELSEATFEALSTLMSNSSIHAQPALVQQLLADMMAHFGDILEAERASADHNRDVVCNVYGLLTLAADTHCKLLVRNLLSPDEAQRGLSLAVLRALLHCSDLPGLYPVDESSSSLAFGFWYTLQDDAMSLDEPECSACLAVVRPVFRQLVAIMLRKCTFPADDADGGWTADDREVFRCYRQDVADTLIYCFNVLNGEYLQLADEQLAQALAGWERDGWQRVEACLYAFLSVSENVDHEDRYLPRLMALLQDIPYARMHPRVLVTAFNVIGAYSEWITDHPAVLRSVIPLLLSGVANPDVSPSATLSLKDLTNNCQRYMAPYAAVVLDACRCCLLAGQLRLNECVRLMYCVGKVLSVLPLPAILDYLNVVLAPCVRDLQQLVAAPQRSAAVATQLVTKLKMLSALFESLRVSGETDGGDDAGEAAGPTDTGAGADGAAAAAVAAPAQQQQQQPVFIVLQDTLPLLREMAARWCGDAQVMEALCATLKHAITTLMDECRPLTADVLQLLMASYRSAPQACVINVSKVLLVLLGRERAQAEAARALLHEIVSVTLQMCACLAEHGVARLSDQADVLEAFFSLLSLVLKKSPRLLDAQAAGPAGMTLLFQCAVVCLALPELHVIKSSALFLVGFICHSRESALAPVVRGCGELLVARILLNLGGATPRFTVDPMTDLLLALNKKYCDDLSRWFGLCLAQDGFPSPKVTRAQKEHFAKTVLREKANKRKLTESVTEFTLICRGILRPDPSNATAL